MTLHLCMNCLEPGAMAYPIGHDQGTQRDPYRTQVDLCTACRAMLEAGHFHLLGKRCVVSRVVAVS